jgi:hypothetical protein
VWWGDNRCPPSTGDGSTGLIASSLAPASSSPSLSSAPLLSTFFLFEKNCEKTAAVLATSFRFFPFPFLLFLPMKSPHRPRGRSSQMTWVSWGGWGGLRKVGWVVVGPVVVCVLWMVGGWGGFPLRGSAAANRPSDPKVDHRSDRRTIVLVGWNPVLPLLEEVRKVFFFFFTETTL